MSELDLITQLIVSWAAGSTGAITAAPAQAVAEVWKERIKDRINGTRRKAEQKAGGRPLDVTDRVAFKVLNEAAFNDDELVADYLGGVLAASTASDDRGASVVGMIGRLSASELRLHYVIYRALAQLIPAGINLHSSDDARQATVRIPQADLVAAIGQQGMAVLGSSMYSLMREGLIDDVWEFGPTGKEGTNWRLQVTPSGVGAELFLWGHGVPNPNASALSRRARLVFATEVPPTPNASLLPRPV